MTSGENFGAAIQLDAGQHDGGVLAFLTGGGEMGSLIRGFDWSRTPIGAPENWSPALRTMVRILLANRFPMLLWWGPEYISIYNDAYRPILGLKHPWGLGQPVRECWSEIWEILRPLIDTPFKGGPSTWIEDMELQINRSGFAEETHFTVAYSPVPDEAAASAIGGVLATVHEITEKVIGERRGRILRDLGTRSAEAKTAEEACANAASTLGKHPKDIPFTLLYLLDTDGRRARLAASAGVELAPKMAPGSLDLDDYDACLWPLPAARSTKEVVVVENLPSRSQILPPGTWSDPPHTAVVVPIRSNIPHQLAGFLVAGLSSRLKFDAGYKDFVNLATSQIATAISSARAYEEERQRAEALAEIDRAKTAFFSNVSHEFRTPLTLMLGPLESVLAKDTTMSTEDREQISTAHRNSLRLLKLVNSLLDFSRIEAGRVKASYTPVDLATLTADLASNFRSAMQAAGLELVVDCPTLPQPVHVDREMWEKIVLNLLSNAFKFTFEGRVTVRIEARDDRAVLTVADTGTGIPEADLAHIFERFHRVEAAQGRTYEGTGIGLALIQELVKLHGGTVDVWSRFGEGSVFTVAVPFGSAHLPEEHIVSSANQVSTALRTEAFTTEAMTWLAHGRLTNPSEDLHAPAPQEPLSRRPRILLADDNADMREHLSRILGSGYEVMALPDGEAALTAARDSKPDLVISDVMMPRLDGFGLLQELRSNPELRDVPIILLSARAGEEARTEGISAGADDYLTKPFSASELLARVQTTLNLQRARREARLQFETLLNQAPLGVYLVDADFRIRQVNPVAQSLFENIPNLIGRDFDEVIHKLWPRGRADEIVQMFRHTLTTGEPYFAAEQIGQRADRSVKEYYEWRIDRIPLPDGRSGVVCYFRDISAQVMAREAIARSEERLASLVTGLTRLHELSGKLAETTDERAGLHAILNSIVELHDADRGLLSLHESSRGLFAAASVRFDEDALEQLARIAPGARGTAFLENRRVVVEDTETDPLFLSFHDIARSLRFRAVHSMPIHNREGRCLGAITAHFASPRRPTELEIQLMDMHARLAGSFIEQARAGQALRDSEMRFRSMANRAPVLIWISGVDKLHNWFNEPWLKFTGRALDQELGNGWVENLHPEDIEHCRDVYDQAFNERREFALECRLRRHDGEWRWLLNHGLPLTEAGAFTGYIGSCIDITEIKHAEQNLRRANQDLEQFAYSASHDLQEPLRGVKIYSELLARRYSSQLDEQALEFLGYVRTGATRMEMLVRDLLTYTQTTLLDMPSEVTDANEALRVALTSLEGAITESGASVGFDPLPSVPVHRTHLQQLFQNLIGNAIKYRRPGIAPEVHVKASPQNAHWLFTVSDNGIGIDPIYKDRVFGLFKRLHTGDQYSGTGIGLAICQRIVERYHGRIWVESKPGEGSTFLFTIPSRPAGQRTAPDSAPMVLSGS